MKIRHLISSSLMGLLCLTLAANFSLAQRFDSAVQERPTEDTIQDVSPDADRAAPSTFTPPSDRTRSQEAQTILINSRYAGWEEATEDRTAGRVGDTIRGNWIMVDANGRFQGKVTAARGADIANMNIFLMNMGRLVKQTGVDTNGQFEFNNVRQGAYSLIGWGEKGFFAFGVNILADSPNADDSILRSVNITAFQNQTTINTDWIRHFASSVSYRVFGRYPSGEGRDDPAKLYGFIGLVSNKVQSEPATSISSHNVSKTADGRLVGRVHQLNSLSGRPVDVRTTKVMLLEGDSVVASTTTDNYGVFEFQQVPDGSYGLAAAGVDGVGLIGINVGSESAINSEGEFTSAPSNLIDFTLVSSETIGWLNHQANEVAYRRALLAPRPPKPAPTIYGDEFGCSVCGGQSGGCNSCQDQYMKSLCRSRGLTFEQWQMYCQRPGMAHPIQNLANDFGSGKFISKAAQQLQRNVQKVDNAFERAFYPNEFNGVPQQTQPRYYGRYGGY
ncbi:MAG: hypothetical protein AB8B55_03170 [Mariniblastus sp.]